MKHSLLSIILTVLMVTAVCLSPAKASSSYSEFWDEQLRTVVEQRYHYERELRETPESEWTTEAIDGYLLNSMMCVYYAGVFHLWEEREHPVTLNAAFNGGRFGGWPGNPFNNWEPMQVCSVNDEFSPGDLVLQIAPDGYWSYMDRDADGNDIARPYNFELAVFGPDVEYAQFSDASPYSRNADWGVKPEGALFMIGAWRETTDITDAKDARRRQAAEEHKEAAGDNS